MYTGSEDWGWPDDGGDFELEVDALASEAEEFSTLFASPAGVTFDPEPLPILDEDDDVHPSLPPRPPTVLQRRDGLRPSLALLTLAASAAFNDPRHALASARAAAGPFRREGAYDRVKTTPRIEPDPEDDVNDDYYFEFLTKSWSDNDVLWDEGIDSLDPSATPRPPEGGVEKAQAASDLFTFLVTGATTSNVKRPLAHEIQHYDWSGTDQRFLAGIDPTPFAQWERPRSTNSFL